MSNETVIDIINMYHSCWKPQGVFERRWTVRVKESIAAANHTRERMVQVGFGLTWILNSWNRSKIEVIVISLESHWIMGENTGIICKCCLTNMRIEN